MAVGNYFDFKFVGDPDDGAVLPVTEAKDGFPRILTVPYVWDEAKAKLERRPPPSEWHSYELADGVYRHAGKAEDDG